MKAIYLPLFLSFMLLFFSCKDEPVEPIDLTSAVTGDWQSVEIYVDGKLEEERYSGSTWLGLRENNFFFRNYVVGTWSLNERTITIFPMEDSGIELFQYEIIDVTDSFLTLKRKLTKIESGRDMEGIEKNEIITVVEKYKRFK